MAWNSPRTWVTNEILSKALLDEQVRDNLAYLKLNIALEAAGELTISAGAVTKSRSHHTIDTEGDAASDDLVSILGGAEGEVILVRPANGARAITIKHNTGNIWNRQQKDVTLDNADDYAFLIYSGSKWGMLSSSGAVDVSGTPEANDIARFTDNDTIEGLSYAELLAVLGVTPSDYLKTDGSRQITGDMLVTAGKKIDGRDISADGALLDEIVAGNPSEDILTAAILFIPDSTGIYYGETDFDVRIRTDAATAGDNFIMQGFNERGGVLEIYH